MSRPHNLEGKLAEILEEAGWVVFENEQDAIEYGLENATDIDLHYADLAHAGDNEMTLEDMVYELRRSETYTILDEGHKDLLTEMFNQYILRKSIDENLLDKLFQYTIHRNI